MKNKHFIDVEEILAEMREEAKKAEIKRDIVSSMWDIYRERRTTHLLFYIKSLTVISVILFATIIFQGVFLIQRGQVISELKKEKTFFVSNISPSPEISIPSGQPSITVIPSKNEVKDSKVQKIDTEIHIEKDSFADKQMEEIFKLYSLIVGIPSISIQEITELEEISEYKGETYDRV